MLYAVILAGGSGTRLWPYSRSQRPKQFLRLNGERTMLQETVERIRPIIPPERVLVATGAVYADLVREQLADVPAENILVEPAGRGTAPCIGLAALHLRRRDPQAVMAVLSADHLIERADRLRQALRFGETLAQEGALVTLGIQPTEPSTGYGYIRAGDVLHETDELSAFRVNAFVEKPDLEHARLYVTSGNYCWNAGIFVWRADRILEELAAHRPGVAQPLDQIAQAMETPQATAVLEAAWAAIENVPIDIAVMEQTARAVVIPTALGWSDLGDWTALAETLPRDAAGNAIVGMHQGLHTRNSLVFGNGRVVATIGVEDLIIVDTHDVLLICHREQAQNVKAMVAQIRQQHADLL